MAEPPVREGAVLVAGVALGICGTDRGILAGAYGAAPEGRTRLVLGHESLGRALEAPPEAGFAKGDLVVGVVRHPDPVPCPSCAAGEQDMCTNGRYTEHGIMGLDGFAAERWRCHARLLVPVPKELERVAVLVEPASVVAKAWDHIERIGARAYFAPRRVLVTGAGPIGLLAALLGVQRGLDVQVLDRVTSGVKPELCKAIGVTYHAGSVADVDVRPDIVLECTGVGSLVLDVIHKVGPSGIVCLTGVGSEGRKIPVDATALNRELVLESAVVFWSVNAGRRHYEIAVKALAAADPTWLDRLITRRVPLARWSEALAAGPDHVKTVLELGG